MENINVVYDTRTAIYINDGLQVASDKPSLTSKYLSIFNLSIIH